MVVKCMKIAHLGKNDTMACQGIQIGLSCKLEGGKGNNIEDVTYVRKSATALERQWCDLWELMRPYYQSLNPAQLSIRKLQPQCWKEKTPPEMLN